MYNKKKLLNRMVLPLLIALAIVFNFSNNASAQGIITDGQVPASQTIENDAIVFGDAVIIEGNVDGDLIAFGGGVEINGDVGGSLITFGRDITINGEVAGSVYSLGVNLNLGPSSNIDRSFYYGGIRLNTAEGSSVARDMVVASLTAQLAGQPGRDLKAMIGLLQFIDIIREGVEDELESQDIPLPSQESEENSDPGTGSQGNPSPVTFIAFHPDRKVAAAQYPLKISNNLSPAAQIDTSRIQNEQLLEWTVDRFEAYITYLIVGLIFMWIFPKRFTEWVNKIRTSPLSVSGYGFLGLVIALNGFVIILILAAILLAIGLGLGYITLWQLAMYFWGISFSSLVLASFVFSLFVFYVSKTIVAFLIGLLIVERISQDPHKHKVLVFALGLLIYILLAAIPYFGWVVGIIAMVLGLGAMLLTFRESRQVTPAT